MIKILRMNVLHPVHDRLPGRDCRLLKWIKKRTHETGEGSITETSRGNGHLDGFRQVSRIESPVALHSGSITTKDAPINNRSLRNIDYTKVVSEIGLVGMSGCGRYC